MSHTENEEMSTSGEKKSRVMEMSIGVGVGCLYPKLTLMEDELGTAASIIYLC